MAEELGLNLRELVDFDTALIALAEAKGNEFTATPRKGASKAVRRSGGKSA